MVIDEADFRSRCQDFADAFGGAKGVHYAGKAFLCTEIVRWLHDEGLSPRRLHRRRTRPGAAGRVPGARIALHGSNKSLGELTTRCRREIGAIVIDSFDEIARLAGLAEHRPPADADPGDGPGHRRRRGAHPRVHRDRARGPEVRLLAGRRRRGRGGPPDRRLPRPAADRPALAHRLADLRPVRVRGRRAPGGRAAEADRRRLPAAGREHRHAGPRRRARHRLHLGRRPAGARSDGQVADGDRHPGMPDRRAGGAARSRSSRAGPSPGRAPSPSTRSAPSRTSRWTAA